MNWFEYHSVLNTENGLNLWNEWLVGCCWILDNEEIICSDST